MLAQAQGSGITQASERQGIPFSISFKNNIRQVLFLQWLNPIALPVAGFHLCLVDVQKFCN